LAFFPSETISPATAQYFALRTSGTLIVLDRGQVDFREYPFHALR
jgi:hypothetical protein